MSVLREKFGISCFAELGIVDLFGLSLSKEELKQRVEFDFHDAYGSHFNSFYQQIDCNDIDNMVSEIEKLIEKRMGEQPVVVRFFAIPDFVLAGFNLFIIAKISNNGSTFVFSKDESIFEYLNQINGYTLSIENI